MTRRILLSAAALLVTGTAHAGLEAEIGACARLPDAAERLACYDALARRTMPVAEQPPPAPPVAGAGATNAAAEPAMRAPPPAPPPDPAPVAATPSPGAEDFGFEKQRESQGLQEIVSHYDGEFNGWSGKTLFRLENGQVWRQSQSGRVSYRATRPVITIRRGALGSFRLSVEGLNATVRVERIK